jgi:hypothetical protein
MLDRYGYIDRRVQSTIPPQDRLRPIPASLSAEQSCPGCAATTCACTRQSSASSRRTESFRQARTFDEVRATYRADGFCSRCAAQASFGHQLGFAVVACICVSCHGKRANYRFAAEHAQRWSGATPTLPARHQNGVAA